MYVYAFFKPIAPLSLPEGIAGAVHIISNGKISALVEPDLVWETLQADDQRLVEAVVVYDRAICTLFAQTVVLPLRFGTQFASVESLQAHLDSNQTQYCEALTQLAGKAEYTLKLSPHKLEVASDLLSQVKGREYFLAKKQQHQTQVEQQQQQTEELQALIDRIARDYTYLLTEATDGVQRIYLLSDRPPSLSLQSHFTIWQTQCAQWTLELSEALPPYHFV